MPVPFTKLFNRWKIIGVPLSFTLDLDDQGKHVVETYMQIDGNKEKIENIENLWNYGTTLKIGTKKYAISTESLNILLSMRSLNPVVHDDGKMVFDVCPPVLRYLRTKKTSVNETDSSVSKIKILEKALTPTAKIDYDPGKELIIETGYKQEGQEEITPTSKLSKTADGGYAKFGNTYYPIQEEADPSLKRWLDVEHVKVSLKQIPEFFKRDLVLLKTKLNAVLTDQAAMIKVIDRPFEVKVKISKDEPGWLDFKIDYTVGKYVLPHEMIKKALGEYVKPDEYSWIHVDNKTTDATTKYLQELGAEITKTGFRLPITQFFSLEDFIKQIGGSKEVTAAYQTFLDEITDFQTDDNFRLSEEAESCLGSNGISLRPYQRAGIHWLSWLTGHYLHGVLADDMGLGKTIQTIVTMRLAYENTDVKRHSLIICPKSIVHFWTREIKRCFPTANICEYIGFYRNSSLFHSSEPLIFITTYETVTRDSSQIYPIPFFFLVLDEATKIKNPDTLRAKAIKNINSIHRIALSGTPIENRPSELWSLFDFLMKGHLGAYGTFVRYFENPITLGDNEMARNLSKRIRPFILRRLKKDVAKDLPEKIDMNEWCELTEEQKSLYGQIQDRYVSPVRDALKAGEIVNYTSCILPVLMKLKQVCDHPSLITGEVEPLYQRSEKFDLVVDKIQEIQETGEKIVIFSHLLPTLDLLEMAFKDKNITYIRIDGSTINRQRLIDLFNNNTVDAALCSIQACGHGITLTSANHVIHINRWWNPAVEDQATDRVHRIGQEKNVYVYKILIRGTLEEKIALLLEKKRDLSDRIIGEAVKEKMQWTRKELLEILKPLE